ncbi:DUF935 family protein [uncultured Fusobacterium sp.]|uniref:phage portal protein family protein n=1 Tax=uncultured Fusobacterium sp. TaxID=159267 RepID=UPI0025FFA69D|nr:DUF935 family protein [uncultured Fusobacterium sp.]
MREIEKTKLRKELILSTVTKLFRESSLNTDTEIDTENINKILKDIDINSALQKLSRAVAGRKALIVSATDENIELEKEIQERFRGIKFNRIVNHLITARYFGYSCFEIVYNEDFTISTLIPIPHQYVSYNTRDKKWVLKIGTQEIELNREKFLLCIHKWNPAQVTGKSIFESCLTSFLDKDMYSKQLRGLAKQYGDVITVYPYDINSSDDEKKQIKENIENMSGKTSIGVPVEDIGDIDINKVVTFIKLSDLDPNVYTELADREKEKLIQNILGSTLTMDNGGGTGSYSLGEIHKEGFDEVVEEICRFVCDSLFQLIEIDAQFHGYNAKEFEFSFEKVFTDTEKIEQEKKQQELNSLKLDNINKLSSAGYELENQYLGEYLGIDYKKIIKKNIQSFKINEFSEDEDKKLFNIVESANTFNTYILSKLEKFTKNISQQIRDQIMNLKEGDEFVLDLDYSLLEDDLIISQLKGYSNSRYTTFNEVIEEFDPFKMKFEEAIKSFLDKTPVLYDTIEEITEEVRANVVWLKKSTDLEITSKLFDNMKKSMESGTTFKQWLKDCDEVINKAGLGNQGYYLENVYRTNMMTQYSIGNYKQQIEVVEEFPYWEYSAIEDNRTSNICKQLDGVIKRYDDPFWSTYYPPNHYQCRSTVISRSKEEIKRHGFKISKDEFDIDVKTFKGNPAESYWNNIKMTAGEKGRQGTFKWE